MTTLATTLPSSSARLDLGAPGAGEDAMAIRDRIAAVARDLFASATGGGATAAAAEQIAALESEAAEDDWDSRGGLAIDPLSVHHSIRFLTMMPASLPAPHVSVDPDGAVSFDWQSANAAFSISFSPDQTLAFAGIFPLARLRGVEYFGEEIPTPVLESLRRAITGR